MHHPCVKSITLRLTEDAYCIWSCKGTLVNVLKKQIQIKLCVNPMEPLHTSDSSSAIRSY